MPKAAFLSAAVAASLPLRIGLSLVCPYPVAPGGDGRLHESKHDGHRLVAIFEDHAGVRRINRNGFDHCQLTEDANVEIVGRNLREREPLPKKPNLR
jgi:hypothetical protein